MKILALTLFVMLSSPAITNAQSSVPGDDIGDWYINCETDLTDLGRYVVSFKAYEDTAPIFVTAYTDKGIMNRDVYAVLNLSEPRGFLTIPMEIPEVTINHYILKANHSKFGAMGVFIALKSKKKPDETILAFESGWLSFGGKGLPLKSCYNHVSL